MEQLRRQEDLLARQLKLSEDLKAPQHEKDLEALQERYVELRREATELTDPKRAGVIPTEEQRKAWAENAIKLKHYAMCHNNRLMLDRALSK